MRPTASSFPESSVNEFRPCSFGAYPEKREPEEENSQAHAQVVYWAQASTNGRANSEGLRSRIVAAVDGGMSRQAVARQF
jgi:hypothetical protein